MAKNLKEETAKALFWNAIDKFGGQFINLVIGVVLARYFLSTQEYGVLGMLSIFIAVCNVLVEGGFSAAIIRKEHATERDYNTVFYVNLFVAVLFYIGLWFSAPLIASYFEQPILLSVSRVLFSIFIINAIGLVQSTLLIRQIKFRIYTRINLTALFVSGVVAIVLAYLNYGVWALVWQIVTLNFIKSAMFWVVSSWRPRLIFDTSSFKELFTFSSKLLLANLISTISTNFYYLFIGKNYQASQLGNYTQADKWSLMAVSTLSGTLQTATYPIFSSIQNDKERTINALRKTMRLTAFVTFPCMILLFVISKPLIIAMLTEKWADSIPLLQILSLAGLFTICTAVIGNILKVYGHSNMILGIEIFRVLLTMLILFYTVQRHIIFVVIGALVVRVIIQIVYMVAVAIKTNYTIKQQIADIYPYALLSIMAGVLVFPLKYIITQDILLIILQLSISIVIYILSNRILKSVILADLITLLTEKIKKT